MAKTGRSQNTQAVFLRMYEDPLVGILRIHAGSPELKICRQFFIKAILYDFELLFL